jgi:glycine dehydrogenase subunit 1
MSYIPNTDSDIQQMLEAIGVRTEEDLFSHIPEELLYKGNIDLPKPLSEMELWEHLQHLSTQNATLRDYRCFLGGGVYHHYIPSVVGHLVGRSEFYTSYTPYQPEISQGTLQAIFEYQTLMCMLTAMDVSNASMYDGASSTAEGALMALRSNKRNRILVSGTLHPEYRQVIETLVQSNEKEIAIIPWNERGMTDTRALEKLVNDTISCVVIQSPNHFGIIEELAAYKKIIHDAGALFIAVFTEPLAFGIIKPPGIFGADIVCGEGQSLGIPPGFGGPLLGVLTCRKELLRVMPGRIVGKTLDKKGNTAYVLTLTAREQHIRREKSTSNICTNHGLCALTATVYLAVLGKYGFRKVSLLNHSRAEYAKNKLLKIDGIKLRFDSPTFNEFVIQTEKDPEEIMGKLLEKKILFGLRLQRHYPELENCILVTFTELYSQEDIDTLCNLLNDILYRLK